MDGTTTHPAKNSSHVYLLLSSPAHYKTIKTFKTQHKLNLKKNKNKERNTNIQIFRKSIKQPQLSFFSITVPPPPPRFAFFFKEKSTFWPPYKCAVVQREIRARRVTEKKISKGRERERERKRDLGCGPGSQRQCCCCCFCCTSRSKNQLLPDWATIVQSGKRGLAGTTENGSSNWPSDTTTQRPTNPREESRRTAFLGWTVSRHFCDCSTDKRKEWWSDGQTSFHHQGNAGD
jgi:hypothetical protein